MQGQIKQMCQKYNQKERIGANNKGFSLKEFDVKGRGSKEMDRKRCENIFKYEYFIVLED
jgi:hypothetical protein